MAISLTRPRIVDVIGWILLGMALIFAIYVRVRLREFPLERDEGEFAYAGQLILQGVPPYKLAYNMKLPGTYIAYAVLMAVFGQSTSGIHLGLLAVNLATIVLLYRLMCELFDPFSAGMAAVTYSIMSVSPSVLGMAAHATHFVAFFGLAGAYVLWRHLQSGRWWQASASGLLMGIAFLMKQQAVFLMVFGGGYLLFLGLRLKSYPRKGLPIALGLYSMAAVLPYGLTCLWLWRAGVWDKFWFWTVTYASKYVQNVPASQAWMYFTQNFTGVAAANWPLWLMAAAGIVALAFLRHCRPGARVFVIGLLVLSFLCVCPGFFFRQHYFIVMLPAVAMLAGVGCRFLWDFAAGNYSPTSSAASTNAERPPSPAIRPKRQQPKSARAESQPARFADFGPLTVLVALVLLAGVAYSLYLQSAFFFVWQPWEACRRTYWGNPFVEAPIVAEYLKKNTTPDQTIAVLGSEPEIFFDSQRKSATGYIYTYGLMEPQPLAAQMQEEMIHEIEVAQPEFIVLSNFGCSWLPQNHERRIFDWAAQNVLPKYRLVGVLDILALNQTDCRWDDAAASYHSPAGRPEFSLFPALPHIMVFRRK